MNKKLFIIFIVILIFLVGTVFYFFISTKKNSDLPRSQITLSGKVFEVEIANTLISRQRGLSLRDGLKENEGMLFLFDSFGEHGFWMKDMRFPIDIIWIKGDMIVGFAENVKPEPEKSFLGLPLYYPPEAVDKVLEVNAGMVQKYGIKAGDRIDFDRNV